MTSPLTPPPLVAALCGHKESHTGHGHVCTVPGGDHSHHQATAPGGSVLLTWPNSPFPPVGSVVVCTEHRGAHVGVVAHHIGNKSLGVAWGLSCIIENRVHAKDAASCAPSRVRVCPEDELPGGDFQRSDLNMMRHIARGLSSPRAGSEPSPTPPSPGHMETRQRQRAAQARHAARKAAGEA